MGTKERFFKFISYKELSKREFQRKIKVSNSYIQNMSDTIGVNILDRINIVYPELNTDWLLTGEGEMLTNKKENNTTMEISPNSIKEGSYTGTLVYDIDGTYGVENRDMYFTDDNIIGSVDLPEINKSSRIIRANGDSMEPKIYDGNRIVIREIMNWNDIFYGQIYFVIMEEYRMIKYIRRYGPDGDNYIILRSENKEYDDIKLHKSKIKKLFIVENILSVKNQI